MANAQDASRENALKSFALMEVVFRVSCAGKGDGSGGFRRLRWGG
jgi:hypothetical protein